MAGLSVLKKISYVVERLKRNAKEISIAFYRKLFLTIVCECYFRTGRVLPPSMRMEYINHVIYKKAWHDFVQEPYPKEIVLVQRERKAYRDWSSLSEVEVKIHLVSGQTHLDLLREPYRGTWAQLLRQYLSQISANSY